jgi:preprotein translocase subunit YajC
VVSAEEDFTDVYIAAVFLVIWAGMSYFLVYRPLKRRRHERRHSTGPEPSKET